MHTGFFVFQVSHDYYTGFFFLIFSFPFKTFFYYCPAWFYKIIDRSTLSIHGGIGIFFEHCVMFPCCVVSAIFMTHHVVLVSALLLEKILWYYVETVKPRRHQDDYRAHLSPAFFETFLGASLYSYPSDFHWRWAEWTCKFTPWH